MVVPPWCLSKFQPNILECGYNSSSASIKFFLNCAGTIRERLLLKSALYLRFYGKSNSKISYLFEFSSNLQRLMSFLALEYVVMAWILLVIIYFLDPRPEEIYGNATVAVSVAREGSEEQYSNEYIKPYPTEIELTREFNDPGTLYHIEMEAENMHNPDDSATFQWLIGKSYESFVRKRALVEYQSQIEEIKMML